MRASFFFVGFRGRSSGGEREREREREREIKKYAREREEKNVSNPERADDDDDILVVLGATFPSVRLQITAIVVPREDAEEEEIAALDDVLHFVRVCVLFGGGFASDGVDF